MTRIRAVKLVLPIAKLVKDFSHETLNVGYVQLPSVPTLLRKVDDHESSRP